MSPATNCGYRAAPLHTNTHSHLQCVFVVCTCMTNVLFLWCLGRLSSAIYLGAWRCHLLFGQWMVLSGKPPDYTQCGNSNETNCSVAMETRSKIFDTLDSYGCHSFHFGFMFQFLILQLIWTPVSWNRVTLHFCISDHKVYQDARSKVSFKSDFSLCVTEQIAIALEYNCIVTAFSL